MNNGRQPPRGSGPKAIGEELLEHIANLKRQAHESANKPTQSASRPSKPASSTQPPAPPARKLRDGFFALDHRNWPDVCALGLNPAVAYLASVLADAEGPMALMQQLLNGLRPGALAVYVPAVPWPSLDMLSARLTHFHEPGT